MKKPYNKGDAYEEKIFQICEKKKILAPNFNRAGASGKSDIQILHKGAVYNIEVKADQNADYGQKYLTWHKANGWEWSIEDEITNLYDGLNLRKLIDKSFIPNRFSKPKDKITITDKKHDQKIFKKKNIPCPLNSLFIYYKNKGCYYIQLENYGFYHLEKYIANLGTKQFDGEIRLRLRAKTNHSKPIYKYSFLAVMKLYKGTKKLSKEPSKSMWDFEEGDGRKFPKILS